MSEEALFGRMSENEHPEVPRLLQNVLFILFRLYPFHTMKAVA